MRRGAIVLTALALLTGAGPDDARAQPPPPSQNGALRVFLDCRGWCDFDFLRTEIVFINYVRDRKEAEVHVLVTQQRTGAGGTEFTLKFIGLERFAGQDDSLLYTSSPTDTDDEERRGFARTFSMGLMRYVAQTPLAMALRIVPASPGPDQKPQAAATPAEDPWNFWIFRASTNGNLFSEEQTQRGSLRGSVSANRTTEELKVSLSASGNYSEGRYDLGDEDEPEDVYVSISRDFSASGLVVKSLTGHWSAAVRASVSASTYNNVDKAYRAWGGVEYNVFPYSESTRRALVLNYTVGPNWVWYREETVYGKMEETLYNHQAVAALSLRQPWGTAFIDSTFSQYLHDLSKNRLELDARVEVRLFRGFTFNVGGSVSRIRDQLSLPAGEASPEEILLLRRQLATGHELSFNWGVSYTFGSIYNNVVNPRFDAR